jgi:hypothetical protein
MHVMCSLNPLGFRIPVISSGSAEVLPFLPLNETTTLYNHYIHWACCSLLLFDSVIFLVLSI